LGWAGLTLVSLASFLQEVERRFALTPEQHARLRSTAELLGIDYAWEESKHPRHEKGSSKGGEFAPKLTPTTERAWDGKQKNIKRTLSKLETGQLGELIVIEWMKKKGYRDATAMNWNNRNNNPIDVVGDHLAIEVKAGLASNGKTAQHWRATIGQPGPKELAWLAKAKPEAKARWNEKKAQAIIHRKEKVVKELARLTGDPIKGQTVTLIIDHDRRIADVYRFPGFHSRIAWNDSRVKKAYVGSYKY